MKIQNIPSKKEPNTLTEWVHFQLVNVVLTHKVVIPGPLTRHHEEAKEAI